MQGKVVMITGATDGIGKAAAFELARQGATLIGVARNPEKCLRVAEEIRTATGNPHIDFLWVDLSVQPQIHDLVEIFKKKYNRLDVLVNNAGGIFANRLESADGIEMTLALNHLNYFLLTNLLLDLLQASAPARVINVASDAHRGGRINFNDLEMTTKYSSFSAYQQSKLANILFTTELARRMAGTEVITHALHPGFVATRFGHDSYTGLMGWGFRMFQKITGRTPEQGAATPVYLASSPEAATETGKYYVDKRLRKPDPAALDLDTARHLWEISEKMTGLKA